MALEIQEHILIIWGRLPHDGSQKAKCMQDSRTSPTQSYQELTHSHGSRLIPGSEASTHSVGQSPCPSLPIKDLFPNCATVAVQFLFFPFSPRICKFISISDVKMYGLDLPFLPLYKAKRDTLAALTALNQTPAISPRA